jgi:hypothetical protein
MGFGDALFAEADVLPPGEHVETVPLALTMTDQHENVLGLSGYFAGLLEHIPRKAISLRRFSVLEARCEPLAAATIGEES